MPRSLRLFVFLSFVLAGLAGISPAVALEVGVAVTDITPRRGEHTMTAMGGAEVVVDKIHDPLFAKVVVLQEGEQRVALVVLDLIVFSNPGWDAIRAGIARDTGIENVICAVTHTHGSGRPGDAVEAFIVTRTLAAAREAAAHLVPATLGHGVGTLNAGYNRRIINADGTVEMRWNNKDRIPSEPVDDDIGVLALRRADDGRALVTLVNYAVHPVISMNFNELIVSADWPGAMADKVAAATGAPCVFLLGAAGDINPHDADMFRYAGAEEVFAAIDREATRIADEVLAVNQRIQTSATQNALAFDRHLLPMALRADGLHAAKTREIELITCLIDHRFALVTFAGELFVELGLDLKRRSPVAATWAVANAYDYSAYLPTLAAACQGGYGASSGTILEVGAGERLVTQALVSLRYQMDLVKPLP